MPNVFKTTLQAAIATLKAEKRIKSGVDVLRDLGYNSRGMLSAYASGASEMSEEFRNKFENFYKVKLKDFEHMVIKNDGEPKKENQEDKSVPDITAMYRQQAKLQEILLDEISKMNFNLNRLTLIAAGRSTVSKEEADFLLSELDKKKNVAKFPFESLIEKGEKEGNSHAVGKSGNS